MSRVYMRGNIWYIDYRYEGIRKREAVGRYKSQAQEALKARLGDIVQGRYDLKKIDKGLGFEELIEEYLRYCPSSVQEYFDTEN